jgi:hypothetical protein
MKTRNRYSAFTEGGIERAEVEERAKRALRRQNLQDESRERRVLAPKENKDGKKLRKEAT